MKKALCLSAFVMLVVVSVGGSIGARAEEHAHDEVQPDMLTVQGEILDMACYMAHEAKGPDHAACAKRCVKGGQPMGLLAKDGTVYLLYANHEDGAAFDAAKELAGQNVELAGKSATQGAVTAIEVHSVKSM